VIWNIAPDFQTAVTRFLAGESDFFEQLRPENVAEIAKHPQLKTRSYHGLGYNFAQFNLRDPADHNRPHRLFGDRNLRRALTMAVDRSSIVRNAYGSMALPALGPTARAYPTTDANLQQIPFDLTRAKALLDSLGWRVDPSDGVRRRSERPLEFSLAVAGTSALRVRMAVLIQEQLRQAGVKVNVEQLEFPALNDKQRKRTFDMVIGQWSTQPSPGSVRGSWGTSGSRAANGNNFGSYESPVFDALVDSALASFDVAKRKAYFTRAYETIIQDAPAIWLAEPSPTVGYHSRFELGILRPDAWWAHIPEWWIPQAKRIPRDNIPVNGAAAGDSAAKKTP
jgi:peptide/nickel transport system substrate-binding protein